MRQGISLMLLALLAGCTEAYMPEVVTSPPGYLVVDGFLNAQGVTTIRLSRTYAVASKAAAPVETRAAVTMEDNAGTRYVLTESSVKGTYASTAQQLNPARQYRLRIITLAGKEYASAFVPVKITPAVDNLRWQVEQDGLNFYVNSHDDANATRYYRWETDETWEIHPPYAPTVEYVTASRLIRPIAVPYPTLCWGNAQSTSVLIDKTTALSQDVVADFRVKRLPANSERLYARYSILVQQHALTKEEYAYWDLLKKNTESIGTLFDPLPAQLTGNVRCLTSPAELALGFVGAHSVAEKRIFINRTDLPRPGIVLTGYETCVPPDTVFLYRSPPPNNPASILFSAFGSQTVLPIDELINPTTLTLYGYSAKPRDCIDCRTRGTVVRPSFW
ncbi:DUF4249 domain-containing protein [Hymenobacter sp. BT439]|uniref:DUF4249 domain-containing protein n=1 Tax=Hymenobacter properus TaxID=2791026 RepID=A0A931BP67_9BACT|nr:DUF4249 domain-containing protein [Hymenobacter properus]